MMDTNANIKSFQITESVMSCAKVVSDLLPNMVADRPEIRASILRLMQVIDAESIKIEAAGAHSTTYSWSGCGGV